MNGKTQEKKAWEDIAKEVIPKVLFDFHSPPVNALVRIEDDVPKGLEHCPTAWFDFKTNRTHMFRKFLDELVDIGELTQEEAMSGVAKHEFGHFLNYPQEISRFIYLSFIAERSLGKYGKEALSYWFDINDNLPQILKERSGREVRALYRGMNRMIEKETTLDEKTKEMIRARGIDPDQIEKVKREYSVDRLLTAYYQKQGGEDLKVDVSGTYLEEKLEELMKINLSNRKMEIPNLTMFNTIISDVLERLEKNLPQKIKGKGQDNINSQGQKIGSGEEPEGGQEGKEQDDLVKRILKPIMNDAPEIKDLTRGQIEQAMRQIIRRHKKSRYDKIKDFVEKETGTSIDQESPKGSTAKGIGLEGSEIKLYQHTIPYYERNSATYGLYIQRKPIVTDTTSNYPEGNRSFRVGDPFTTLNPYSSGGRILPGITQRRLLKQGKKTDRLFKTPTANIIIDSSGSMENPDNGSIAILAAFILAKNYYANDAEVGVINFSADMAYLPPTRDLNKVYTMLTAFWGGGTVLNVKKMREFIGKMDFYRGFGRPVFTSEKDYEEILERLNSERRREFIDKNLTLDFKDKVRENYEKLDNIMITDGGIANIGETIRFLNDMGKITRNTIFLLGNEEQFTEWIKYTLPNTQIILVKDKEDLIGHTIGKAQTINPAPERPPQSLFYK
ncbi:MAG TPA: VWA domain-containing protein [Candidatus Nanoarchaeia archaeon]|nr:VWA domain-containing protein [Candidatus Nanoarchaeia archaeon]